MANGEKIFAPQVTLNAQPNPNPRCKAVGELNEGGAREWLLLYDVGILGLFLKWHYKQLKTRTVCRKLLLLEITIEIEWREKKYSPGRTANITNARCSLVQSIADMLSDIKHHHCYDWNLALLCAIQNS